MKCRYIAKKKSEGIALVITLVMLAVVTVMAIVFLGVTRRERASTTVTQETAIAKDMADAALERVKTEVMAKMNASGSRLNYDLFNSTAFYNTNGFRAADGATNINVGPVWDWPAVRNSGGANYLQLLANLQYDPAVPVFVETNRNGDGDFRYYLDFNRNQQFETNGLNFDYDASYRPIEVRVGNQNITPKYKFVGDPEWIGVLERPDFPHSETNRFVGRLAYLVLPAGKTLDLNFMHNHVNGATDLSGNGFSRGQGVGPWEINLAAFLRELNGNTYSWPQISYNFGLQPTGMPQPSGFAFDDARALLAFRYRRTSDLLSMYDTLGRDNLLNPGQPPGEFAIYQRNYSEDFSRRPYIPDGNSVFFAPGTGPNGENGRDYYDRPGWPGSVNTNAFTDLQQLFSVDASSQDFVRRLLTPGRLAGNGGQGLSGRSSSDRYTIYRLAGQLGTDSSPELENRIHLNFKNPIGIVTNQTERWSSPSNAIVFFTNAAELMLKASIDGTLTISNDQQVAAYKRPHGTYHIIGGDTLVRTNFSITNIQIYATNNHRFLEGVVMNEYTPTIHRILQVAANIYDSMTNRDGLLPSTFGPVFERTPSNIVLRTFVELAGTGFTNSADGFLLRPWTDPESAYKTNATQLSRFNLYGQHIVVGAKKGHPNFNELALNSRVEFSRKLSFTKANTASTNMVATNQMFLLDLDQRWGMEAWNSYLAEYRRSISVTGVVISTVALWDDTNRFALPVYTNTITMSALVNSNSWRGRDRFEQVDDNMLVLMDRQLPLITEQSYSKSYGVGAARIRPTNDFNYTADFELPPQFMLYTTNKVRFWIRDNATGRLIDFVSFDRLTTQMDLRDQLNDKRNLTGTNANQIKYWDTNRIGNGPMTVGVSNQIAVSLGNLLETTWRPYRYNIDSKGKAISKFRAWMGLPLRTGIDTNLQPAEVPQGIRHQVPYTPTRQMVQRLSWQVNDPLVHYMVGDLRRRKDDERPEIFDNVDDRVVNRTNQWNIALRNKAYHPWGELGDQDPFAWNVGLVDPGVRSSDSWEFNPTITNFYHYPNIGTLGQVHRGTPWQTIYLKSFYRTNGQGVPELFTQPSVWYEWAGSIGTHPTRDWRLLDAFTTALNENSARGLLSVNQTNQAAWSAVLSGALAATNHVRVPLSERTKGTDPTTSYRPIPIEPTSPNSPQLSRIVRSINEARTNQLEIVRNPDPNANKNMPYIARWVTNSLSGQKPDVWRYMGEVVSAPALSVQSPFLNGAAADVQGGWTDKAVEYIPQQILSLLQRDEPRFVVYAFGQSLKPAPGSLTSDPNFYHMCTNYQITGEVITKTTFRVEGQSMNQSNPLRPVVEKYEILPPLE